jgi:aspartate-semialdehyde dehydrogenase
MKTVAIVGATGVVGKELLRLLEERHFPLSDLRLFASSRSRGQRLAFHGESIPVEVLASPIDADLAFFAADAETSLKWIGETLKRGTIVIDSSSAYRLDPSVPLIIPEINAHAWKGEHLIASPNCTATVLLLPLAPLHQKWKAKRVICSTYQAASGGGAALLDLLDKESQADLKKKAIPYPLGYPYAFNLFPHNSPFYDNGYCEEEMKIVNESRKILQDSNLKISATCVRVPVRRAHSLSANVEFFDPPSVEEAYELWRNQEGLQIFEDRSKNRFATPSDASGLDEILCGRLRIDPTQPNTLEFWAVGDQALKGAALNAVQIGELLEKRGAPLSRGGKGKALHK